MPFPIVRLRVIDDNNAVATADLGSASCTLYTFLRSVPGVLECEGPMSDFRHRVRAAGTNSTGSASSALSSASLSFIPRRNERLVSAMESVVFEKLACSEPMVLPALARSRERWKTLLNPTADRTQNPRGPPSPEVMQQEASGGGGESRRSPTVSPHEHIGVESLRPFTNPYEMVLLSPAERMLRNRSEMSDGRNVGAEALGYPPYAEGSPEHPQRDSEGRSPRAHSASQSRTGKVVRFQDFSAVCDEWDEEAAARSRGSSPSRGSTRARLSASTVDDPLVRSSVSASTHTTFGRASHRGGKGGTDREESDSDNDGESGTPRRSLFSGNAAIDRARLAASVSDIYGDDVTDSDDGYSGGEDGREDMAHEGEDGDYGKTPRIAQWGSYASDEEQARRTPPNYSRELLSNDGTASPTEPPSESGALEPIRRGRVRHPLIQEILTQLLHARSAVEHRMDARDRLQRIALDTKEHALRTSVHSLLNDARNHHVRDHQPRENSARLQFLEGLRARIEAAAALRRLQVSERQTLEVAECALRVEIKALEHLMSDVMAALHRFEAEERHLTSEQRSSTWYALESHLFAEVQQAVLTASDIHRRDEE